MSPADHYAYLDEWGPVEQAAGLCDLAIEAFRAAADHKGESERRLRLEAVKTYLEALLYRLDHKDTGRPVAPAPELLASAPRVPWQRCAYGKRGYPSERAALRDNASNGLSLRAYKCDQDHRLHHVTKNLPASRKRRGKYRARRRRLKIEAERET